MWSGRPYRGIANGPMPSYLKFGFVKFFMYVYVLIIIFLQIAKCWGDRPRLSYSKLLLQTFSACISSIKRSFDHLVFVMLQ